jgi:hypothetical protein
MEKLNNVKIVKVWFDEKNINLLTNDGTQKSHPLRWFDRLWNATPEQREQYELSSWADSIHWPELDEDLSLEGFYTYNKDEIENQKNEVSRVFDQFPVINITRFAERVKINRSLLASYVCNEKKPGTKNKKQIEAALHQLGKDLLAVKL